MRIVLTQLAHDFLGLDALAPDLGLGFLAAALRKRGFEPEIIHARLAKAPTGVADRIGACAGPLLVGLKLFSMDLDAAREATAALRARFPDAVITAGGPHPSAVDGGIFRELPELDYSFSGEAELGLPMLVELLHESARPGPDRLGSIPGLVWRSDDGVRANPPGRVENLDELGMPAWDLMNIPAYAAMSSNRMGYVGVLSSRGCAFDCAHCLAPKINGRRVRLRSPALVLDEIEHLRDAYGVRHVSFVDDSLTGRRDHIEALCRGWIDRRIGISWDCSSNGIRFDALDRDMILLMSEAGCNSVGLALESASPRTLQAMNRDYDPAAIRDKIAEIRRLSRMEIRVYFILGYPYSTRADLEADLAFSRTVDADIPLFFLFSPFPGTAIYERLKADGMLPPLPCRALQYETPALPLEDVSLEELKRYQVRAYRGYMLRPGYLWKRLRREGFKPRRWLGRLARLLAFFRR